MNVSHLEGEVTVISDEEVAFARCVEQSYVVVESGEETDRVEGERVPGEGVAVLVGGEWRLREVTSPPGLQGCTDLGEAA